MDPREHKLPKWAQDLLTQERMNCVVRFPDEPAPPPDISEELGHARAPRSSWIYSTNVRGVRAWWVAENGYIYKGMSASGFGTPVRGNFWLKEEDAHLAHLWDVCTCAARDILRVRATIAKSRGDA